MMKVKNIVQRMITRIQRGFTIVELLIVLVVLGILFTITVVSYGSINNRADTIRIKNDLENVEARLAQYATHNNGQYPATTSNTSANWKSVDVETDMNCFNGSALEQWVPTLEGLPQSISSTGAQSGVDGSGGCYLYASNGEEYVLSAWNILSEPSDTTKYYRRLGFRTFQTATSAQFFTCNENVTGGMNGGYDVNNDYYKHSFTISNITDCDETPPPGAE
ncbi:MAG: prepilin-type N-terminal cleavage/methylation domain-containing protein [Candidatus Microsaccharimonas sp.]